MELTHDVVIARRERISRRLSTAGSPRDRAHWRFWFSDTFDFLVAGMLLFLCVPLELRWSPSFTLSVHLEDLTILLIMAFLLNGWLIDRYFERNAPGLDGLRLRIPFRLLRATLGGIPLVGIWLVPVIWRSFRARDRTWAFRTVPPPKLRLTGSSLTAHLHPILSYPQPGRLRWLGTWLPWFWLVLGNFLLLVLTTLFLITSSVDQDTEAGLITASIILIHGFGLLATGHYLWRQIQEDGTVGWRKWTRFALPALWLLPFYAVLGIMLFEIILRPGRSGSRMMSGTAHHTTDDIALLAPASKTPGFGDWSTEQRHRLVDWHRVRLQRYRRRLTTRGHWWASAQRLKTFLTACDGVVLGWLASRISTRISPPDIGLESLLLAFTVVLTLFVIAGLLRSLLEIASRWRESSPTLTRGVGWQVAQIAVALLVGASVGTLFEQDEPRLAGGLLAIAAILYLFGLALRLMVPSGKTLDKPGWLPWAALFLTLLATGQVMLRDESTALVFARLFPLLALLLPIGHGAFAAAFLHRLLYPFGLEDLRGTQIPKSVRQTLRQLAATIVLPLGGLAIPWWVSLQRDRWPGALVPWVQTLSSSSPPKASLVTIKEATQ